MLKHILLFVLVAMLLQACKQQGTEEKKYTIREHDSIVKAKHEYEFDSVLVAYVKANPNAFYLLKTEHRFLPLKTVVYTTQKLPITIEHKYFPRSCVNVEILYVRTDSASQIIELPWHNLSDTTRKLISLSNDFNSMLTKLKVDYGDDFWFLDAILSDNFHLERIWPDEGKMLPVYEETIRHIGGCEDMCFKNLSATIQRADRLLKTENTRLYTNGLNFISVKVEYNSGIPKVEFEILNPECSCMICI